jgi:hypothetical protein
MLLVALVLVSRYSALAHGMAGDRYFPGTSTFDDPGVGDEAVAIESRLADPMAVGGEATHDALTFRFRQLLTSTLEIGGDTTQSNRPRQDFSRRKMASARPT